MGEILNKIGNLYSAIYTSDEESLGCSRAECIGRMNGDMYLVIACANAYSNSAIDEANYRAQVYRNHDTDAFTANMETMFQDVAGYEHDAEIACMDLDAMCDDRGVDKICDLSSHSVPGFALAFADETAESGLQTQSSKEYENAIQNGKHVTYETPSMMDILNANMRSFLSKHSASIPVDDIQSDSDDGPDLVK